MRRPEQGMYFVEMTFVMLGFILLMLASFDIFQLFYAYTAARNAASSALRCVTPTEAQCQRELKDLAEKETPELYLASEVAYRVAQGTIGALGYAKTLTTFIELGDGGNEVTASTCAEYEQLLAQTRTDPPTLAKNGVVQVDILTQAELDQANATPCAGIIIKNDVKLSSCLSDQNKSALGESKLISGENMDRAHQEISQCYANRPHTITVGEMTLVELPTKPEGVSDAEPMVKRWTPISDPALCAAPGAICEQRTQKAPFSDTDLATVHDNISAAIFAGKARAVSLSPALSLECKAGQKFCLLPTVAVVKNGSTFSAQVTVPVRPFLLRPFGEEGIANISAQRIRNYEGVWEEEE